MTDRIPLFLWRAGTFSGAAAVLAIAYGAHSGLLGGRLRRRLIQSDHQNTKEDVQPSANGWNPKDPAPPEPINTNNTDTKKDTPRSLTTTTTTTSTTTTSTTGESPSSWNCTEQDVNDLDKRIYTWLTAGNVQLTSSTLMLVSTALTRAPHVSAWFFLAGNVLFCGSVYAMVLVGGKLFRCIRLVKPLGGLCHLLGWLALLAGR